MNKIRHIGIYVDDLEGMKQFYCNYFSLKEVVHTVEESQYIDTVLGLSNCRIELYKLQASDGSMMELLKYKDDNSKRSIQDIFNLGCSHTALTVGNIDSLYKKMLGEGIRFISKPVISPDGKAKVCFCKDPEGNYLELVEGQ